MGNANIHAKLKCGDIALPSHSASAGLAAIRARQRPLSRRRHDARSAARLGIPPESGCRQCSRRLELYRAPSGHLLAAGIGPVGYPVLEPALPFSDAALPQAWLRASARSRGLRCRSWRHYGLVAGAQRRGHHRRRIEDAKSPRTSLSCHGGTCSASVSRMGKRDGQSQRRPRDCPERKLLLLLFSPAIFTINNLHLASLSTKYLSLALPVLARNVDDRETPSLGTRWLRVVIPHL